MVKKIIIPIIVAFILWMIMFAPFGLDVNFWAAMTGSAIILTSMAVILGRNLDWSIGDNLLKNILFGTLIACFMWGVFWIGDKISSLLFDFAHIQVDAIYSMKGGNSPVIISLLLLFIIGPAEEIFWRGYIQRSCAIKWGNDIGLIVSVILYTIVHISSLNFMLIMSALVAGAVWGTLYRFFPRYFLAIIISHSLWDAAVFIWFPIL